VWPDQFDVPTRCARHSRVFSLVEQSDWLRGVPSSASTCRVAVPLVKKKICGQETPTDPACRTGILVEHLSQVRQRNRRRRWNLNLLGESPARRKDDARNRLQNLTFVLTSGLPRHPMSSSVKPRRCTVQVSALAYEHTIDVVTDRLESLYPQRETNHKTGKFIYLDMEINKDLSSDGRRLETKTRSSRLGTTPQACAASLLAPDSQRCHARLIEWSRKRVAGGGTQASWTSGSSKELTGEMERVHAVDRRMHDGSLTSTSRTPMRTTKKMLRKN